MSNNLRIKAFMVTLLTMAATVLPACGNNGGNSNDTTVANTDAAGTTTAATTTAEYSYPYPEKGYNGEEYNILNTNDMWTMHSVIGREESTGDALDDAIYKRNTNLEEKLGIVINETLTDNDYQYGTLLTKARNSILSGTDEFDVMYLPMHLISAMATEGSFNNLLDISTIQLDKSWWYSSYNDAMTINDALYGALGGSNLMIQDAVRVLTFNQNMMDNLGLDQPYDLVREGKWTLDRLNEYLTAAASLNGDDSAAWKKDGKTVYGLANHGGAMVYYMIGSGEFNIETVDGVIKNTCGTARWYDVISKISNLLTVDDAKFIPAFNGVDTDPDQGGYIYIFTNQRALFGVSEVNKFQGYRSLDFDYGVVPFPKYDEAQTNYYSNTYEGATGAFIPVTSSDPEKVGLILDAMSYEGETNVVPVFREISVESKGLRNDDSIEMLDIIMDSIVPRIGKMFAIDDALQSALDTDIIKKNNTAASIYATNQEKINAEIDKIMTNWNK